MKKIIFYSILSCLLLCVQNSIKAFSQDTTKIYVNTANGDDLSNDGYSTSSPLKTINKAIQKADPGETIIVAAGSYDEQITPAKNGKPDSLITFLADTAGQYFSGYVGHVTINGNLSNDYGFNLTDRSYISIIGFTFQYHRQQPIFINAQTSNITNINIQNCKFSYWGQNTMADSSAILIYSNSGYSIKNINIWKNNFNNISETKGSKTIHLTGDGGINRNINIAKNIFSMNTFRNNECVVINGNNAAIYITENQFYQAQKAIWYRLNADSIFIINNFIYSTFPSSYGIVSDVNIPNAVKIIYNTINTYSNCIIFNNSAQNISLVNNILYATNAIPLYVNSAGLFKACNYNLYNGSSTNVAYYAGSNYNLSSFKTTDHVADATNGDENSLYGNPQFTPPGSFYLYNTSPAIDTADIIDISDYEINVNKDINGMPRDKNTPTIGCYEAYGKFHGTYSIGLPDGDFPTISSAISAISSANIDGPVVFNIKNGIYNEDNLILSYLNLDENKTVSFIGQDKLNTIILSNTGNSIFILENTKYISFKNLTFNLSSSYSYALRFNSNNSHITIENCRFVGVEETTYIIAEETSYNDYITINNNSFENGDVAISFLNIGSNFYVVNNKFLNQNTNSVYLYYFNDSIIISNNYFFNNRIKSSGFDGVYINNCTNSLIKNNVIKIQNGGNGISIYNSINGDLINNVIAIDTCSLSFASIGLSVSESDNINAYYNTITNGAYSSYSPSAGIYANLPSDVYRLTLYNNIVSCKNGVHGLFFDNYSDFIFGYYNIIYSADACNYYDNVGCADQPYYLQNTISIQPILTNDSIPYPLSCQVPSGGYRAEVTMDIYGNTRSSSNPKMGAYEHPDNVPLNGTLHVGKGKDLPTLELALKKLSSCGVSGAVTIELTDNIYNENVFSVNSIPGANETNTVTIKPASGVDATINIPINQTTDGITFNDVSYLIIDGSNNGTDSRNLQFKIIDETSTHSASVLYFHSLDSSIRHITIKNCILSGANNYEDYNFKSSIYMQSADSSFHDILIENNELSNNHYGIYLYSINSSFNININKNLIVSNIKNDGIYIENAHLVSITNNNISNITNQHGEAAGIYLNNVASSKITGNIIQNIIGSSSAYGIYYRINDTISSGLIANNSIMHIAASQNVSGIYSYITNSNSWSPGAFKILNNTINLNYDNINGLTDDGNVYGIFISQYSNNYNAFQILNNIFSVNLGEIEIGANNTSAIGLYVGDNTMINESNYNLFEVNGCDYNYETSINGTGYSLDDWKSYTSLDQNSINTPANFISNNDNRLNYNSPCIDAGKPNFNLQAFGITTDVYGNNRVENDTIDIGAYEFKKLLVTKNGPTNICPGQEAIFTVSPNMPAIFQWQSSSDGSNWSIMPGKTADSIHVRPTVDTYYRCIVNAVGQETQNITFPQLVINIPVSITAQPSSQTVCEGSDASFSVTTSGTGLNYQWQVSADNGSTWNDINGQTTSTLSLSSVTIALNANQYRCVVNGTCGNVFSNPATLTVNENAQITAQPSSQTVCEGSDASFSVTAQGTGIAYQWQVSADNGSTWNDLTGETAATFNLSSATISLNANQYRCVVNGTCGNVFSNPATLTVNTLPNFEAISADAKTTVGGSISIFANNGTPPYQYSINNGLSYETSAYFPNLVAGSYEVVVKDVNGCVSPKQDILINTSSDTYYVDFSYTISGNTITLNNLSQGTTTNYWLYGDGKYAIDNSNQHNYTYSYPGSYNICLKGYDINGKVQTTCKKIQTENVTCTSKAGYIYMVKDNRTVKFENTSENANSYYWYFDDGATSTEISPEHTYSTPGYYLVTLTVEGNEVGCSDYYMEMIKVGEVGCVADFDFQINNDTKDVVFYNLSSDNSSIFYWLFGDGSASTDISPSHTYKQDGLYNVSLTIVDNTGLCYDYESKEVQIGEISCKSEFSYYVDDANKAYFYSNSSFAGISNYWLFGDGGISVEQNPIHKYSQPGYYKVSLTTYNQETGCMDYSEKNVLILSSDMDCYADFVYTVDAANRTVNFYDKSSGNIVKWLWNYGDNTYEEATNPSHMFNKTKKYNVCLTVINNKGLYDIECKEVIIEENPENVCNADFIYMIDSTSKTVQFTNKSTGNYNQVIWDFNDGGTSTDPNPVHSYSMPGYYLVSLKISNSETKQYDYSFKLLNIASPDSFLVKFAYLSHPYNQKAGGYPIDFIGAGLGDQAKLKWDFGDGASDSTSTTPQHIYSQPGDYQTCLTYSDPITDNSTTYCDVVTTQTICNSDLEPPVAICKELTLYLKEGQSITLTPDQIDNGSYDECGTISKKEISKTTFNAIGSYNVMLKVYDSKNNADSCSTIVNVQPDVSVNNIQNLSYLNVFPNPFGYELKINYSINKSGKIEILITDIAGKRVKNLKHGFVEKGSYSEVYSTSDIEKGVYILQVTIDGQLNGQKFVIKQ